MTLIISLIYCSAFYFFLAPRIQKRPWIFYALAGVIIGSGAVLYLTADIRALPKWVITFFYRPVFSGGLSISTFIIVMYLGAIPTQNAFYKRLRPVRRELSMIACFFTLFHNLAYGLSYFPKFFTQMHTLNTLQIIATSLSLIGLAVMLPLFVTSFKAVQSKMPFDKWKRLQRWAYLFYAVVYLHVMVIFSNRIHRHVLDMILYTAVFGTYAVMRIYKARSRKPQVEAAVAS